MRSFKALVSLFLSSLLAVNLCYAATEKNSNGNKTNEGYLLIQGAAEAMLEQSKDDPSYYLLTLKQVNPYVMYFSERPTRKAGQMPMEKYLHFWKSEGPNNFQKNPPNADLHAIQRVAGSPDKIYNFILELFDPNYDSAKQTISYRVKPLEGNPNPLPSSATFQQVTLFIDDICVSCF